MENEMILVTGATGYIGGRLVPRLLTLGYQVRVFVRDITRLQGRFWAKDVDLVQGDVFNCETLGEAMEGIQAAYYLIHSMSGSHDFHERDLVAARNFGTTAKKAGVEQITDPIEPLLTTKLNVPPHPAGACLPSSPD